VRREVLSLDPNAMNVGEPASIVTRDGDRHTRQQQDETETYAGEARRLPETDECDENGRKGEPQGAVGEEIVLLKGCGRRRRQTGRVRMRGERCDPSARQPAQGKRKRQTDDRAVNDENTDEREDERERNEGDWNMNHERVQGRKLGERQVADERLDRKKGTDICAPSGRGAPLRFLGNCRGRPRVVRCRRCCRRAFSVRRFLVR